MSMKQQNPIFALTLILSLVFAPTPQAQAQQKASEPQTVPGEIIVKFRTDVLISQQSTTPAGLDALASEVVFYEKPVRKNSGVIQSQSSSAAPVPVKDLALVKLKKNISVKDAIDQCEKNPMILYAEPNYIVKAIQTTPNDPDFSSLWGLNSTTNHDIDAPEAWDITTGDPSLIVAVIDTGIDYNHDDLKQNMWKNSREIPGNGIDDDRNGYVDDVHGLDLTSVESNPIDRHGHGTHVAGTIGAVGNNNLGVTGVNWKVKLMAVKFLNDLGFGSIGSAIPAIRYAVQNGALVINNSWGGGGHSQALQDVINEAHDAGVVVVAAAGNENSSDLFYPAAYENVVAVGATDRFDQRASFSSYGSYVDVAAPGVDILSTLPNNTYGSHDGTSMASPHVAGVAALIKAKRTDFSNEEVIQTILNTVDPITTDKKIGLGRVNAHKAVTFPSPPALARLEQPIVENGQFDLIGTAAGRYFESYEIDWGRGKNPTTWVSLLKSQERVENNVFLSGIQFGELPHGLVTIRLRVRNIFGTDSVVQRRIDVVKKIITAPLATDLIRMGDRVSIQADIDASFDSYTVEWGNGLRPQKWESDGIELTLPSTDSSFEGEVATWDTSVLLDRPDVREKSFAIRLTLKNPFGDSVQTKHFLFLERQLKPGWPASVSYQHDPGHSMTFDSLVGDLTGDGQKNVVVLGPTHNGFFWSLHMTVFDNKGQLVWSDMVPGSINRGGIKLGDVNNDGRLEIVFSTESGEIHALTYTQEKFESLPGWPRYIDGGFSPVATIADMNNNGKNETIYLTDFYLDPINFDYGKLLGVMDENGAPLFPPVRLPDPSVIQTKTFRPVVGNFVGDENLEIAVQFKDHQVALYDMKGELVPGWPATIPNLEERSGSILVDFVVGDMDGDGYDNLVVTADHSGLSFVHVFKNDGTLLPGWPAGISGTVQATPSLADFNQDGQLDLVVGVRDRFVQDRAKIFVFDAKGQQRPGWPIFFPTADINDTIVVGDVDGDHLPDVVVASRMDSYGLVTQNKEWQQGIYAWNRVGHPIDLDPKTAATHLYLDLNVNGSLVLDDIDGNGKIDLIGSAVGGKEVAWEGSSLVQKELKRRGHVFVYELGTPYHSDTIQWSTFMGNPQQTGRYKNPLGANSQPPVLDPVADIVGLAGKKLTHQFTAQSSSGKTLIYWFAFYSPEHDLNNDGLVDYTDLLLVQSAQGSKPGDASYREKADVNKDNVINIFDVFIFMTQRGKRPQGFSLDQIAGTLMWDKPEASDVGHYDATLTVKEIGSPRWTFASRKIKIQIKEGLEFNPIPNPMTFRAGEERFYEVTIKNPGNRRLILEANFYNSDLDLNLDGVVDPLDDNIIRDALGSSLGDPRFNPVADIFPDGKINNLDWSSYEGRKYLSFPSGVNRSEWLNGRIRWTPTRADIGRHTITFVAKEYESPDLYHTETIELLVEAPNINSVVGEGQRQRDVQVDIPDYPNEFRPSRGEKVKIGFSLQQSGPVTIQIYNRQGEVATILNGHQAAGAGFATWDGRDRRGNVVGTGAYRYEIKLPDTTRKGHILALP